MLLTTVDISVMKNYFNVLLLIISLIISFAVCEIIVRLIDPGAQKDRVLFFSSKAFEETPHGVVFEANKRIRTLTVYGNKVEYDITFNTNNYGFVDDIDYGNIHDEDYRKRNIAFVGDSFTAGYHGGKPWIPLLRKKLAENSKYNIYNLGVSGTGVIHFCDLLKNIKNNLYFTDIFILALSSDFTRPHWTPVIKGQGIIFAVDEKKEGVGRRQRPIAYILEGSSAETLNFAREIYRERFIASGKFYTLKGSKFLAFLYNNFILQRPDRKKVEILKNSLFLESITRLQALPALFPNTRIHFFHLPQKDEVISGEYLIPLEMYFSGSGITYHPVLYETDWVREMFYKNDGHPNQAGYDHIQAYFYDFLEEYAR